MPIINDQPLLQGEGHQGDGCQGEGNRQGEDDRAMTEVEYLEMWLQSLSELVASDSPVAISVVIQTEQARDRLEYIRKLYNPTSDTENETGHKPILKSYWEWGEIYPERDQITKPQMSYNLWKNVQLDEEAYRIILERRNNNKS